MSRADRLTHLAGYAGIVAVLGAATWSGIVGGLFAMLFVGGAAAYGGYVGYDILTDRLRAEAEAAAGTTPSGTQTETVSEFGEETLTDTSTDAVTDGGDS